MNQKRKSFVWKYFMKQGEKVACRLCLTEVKTSGNTTNLKNHLQRKHKKVLEMEDYKNKEKSCDNNNQNSSCANESCEIISETDSDAEDEISSLCQNNENDDVAMKDKTTEGETESVSNLSFVSSSSSTATKIQPFQPTIQESFQLMSSFSDGAKHKNITNALLFMIAKDNLPLDLPEKEGFKHFMRIAVPLYKLPGRTKITSLLNEKFITYSNIIKNHLKEVNCLNLTTDVWTDALNTTSYLGLTVHYIHEKSYKSIIFGVEKLSESHTAEYLSTCLLKMCTDWNIDLHKVVAVVTDNGANIVKAVGDTFDKKKHLPCFAHTINLVASAVLNEKCIKPIMEKVKAIVTYFKQSVSASDQLRKVQQTPNPLKLIQAVPTRWNSYFYMLERFLELSELLMPILLKNPKSPAVLTAIELHICKETIFVLQPLEQVTKEVSSDRYVTVSKVIPLVSCLRNKIQNLNLVTAEAESLKTSLLAELQKRFGSIEENKLLAVGTLLDPRFKKIHFYSAIACSQAINFVNKVLNEKRKAAEADHKKQAEAITELQCNRSNDIWSHHKRLSLQENLNPTTSEFDELDHELKIYLNTPTVFIESDPLHFVSNSFLGDIAVKYLSVPATSVPSERAFSQAGNIITSKRNRLSSKHLSQLMFLHSLDSVYWKDF